MCVCVFVYSSRSESAEGRLSVASIYGIGSQQCHCQWKYILRPLKPCPHFRQHFCLFVSLSRSLDNLAGNEHNFLL